MLSKAELMALGMLGGGSAMPWYLSGSISGSNCVAAYQPKGAASEAASYVNLNNPATHTLIATTAPVLSADGWVFDGVSQFLVSDFAPGAGQTMSVVVVFSGLTNAGRLFGSYNGTHNFYITPDLSGNVRYAHGGTYNAAPSLTSGSLGFAGDKAYRNSVSEPSTIPTAATTNTRVIYIGAMNNSGTTANYVAATISHIAFYSTVLNPTQISAVMEAANPT